MPVPFSKVLELFERHEWALMRIVSKRHFVFENQKILDEPFVVKVREKQVSDAIYRRIRDFFNEEPEDEHEGQ